MKYINPWLQNNYLPENRIGEIVKAYQQDQNVWHKADLVGMLTTIATNIVKYAKCPNVNEDEAVDELVSLGFERLPKPKSCGCRHKRLFNYFCTIMMNRLREIYRRNKTCPSTTK